MMWKGAENHDKSPFPAVPSQTYTCKGLEGQVMQVQLHFQGL